VKIKTYQIPDNSYEKGELKPLSDEELNSKFEYYEGNIQDKVMIRMPELILSWKEYYYTDLEGSFKRSEIDLVTLVLPKGSTPTAQFGDLSLFCMKFADIKAYFDDLYTSSKGKIAGIKDMSMAQALEQHQYHTSSVYQYFNPFCMNIDEI
jgi:hypothetical protein